MACLVSGTAWKQKEFGIKQEKSCCSHGENLTGTSMASISKVERNCSKRNIDLHDISVNNVLTFLKLLYESGLGYSSINTSRFAFSSLDCGNTCPVGNRSLIFRFMTGVYISRTTQSRYTVVWDIKVVLDYFKDNQTIRNCT